MSVTEKVWAEQLQALKNITKADLHQSMKCMQKLFIAGLKIPFTYVVHTLLMTTLAIFLWIQGM